MIYYGGNLFRTSGLLLSEFLFMILMALTVIPVDMTRKLWLKSKGVSGGVEVLVNVLHIRKNDFKVF